MVSRVQTILNERTRYGGVKRAEEALLETYQAERRPIAAGVLVGASASKMIGMMRGFGRKPRTGDTLPDVECVRAADARNTRLYQELGGRWALLVPAGGAASDVSTVRQRLGDDGFVVMAGWRVVARTRDQLKGFA